MKKLILISILSLIAFCSYGQTRIADLQTVPATGTQKIPVSGSGTPGPAVTVSGIGTFLIKDEINNGETGKAPTENAVYDALHGAIVPTSVNGVVISGSSTPTLAVTGTTAVSGTHSGTSSGSNTGDQTISITGDVTASGSTSSLNATVTKINGTALSGLATGILKNTTSTGVPSIATAGTDYVSPSGTETLTNKRISPRVQAVTSSATVTPNADSDDAVKITAQAAGLTLANPSGTPTAMQSMAIRIKDNGTARAITYGSQYRAIGVTLPSTTVISKTVYLWLIWNADDSKWDVTGVSQEN